MDAQQDWKLILKKGQKLTKSMINIKRPGTGLPPNFIYKIIGTKLLKNKTKDSIINLSDIRTKNKL